MSSADTEHNVAVWTRINAEHLDATAHRNWAAEEITWGIWKIPDRELGVLGDVAGLDVVELGCGTAYFGARLARRGAHVVGVDPTPAQLATARRLMGETGVDFPLVEAGGEAVPLPDASFDLALSEYGASIWAEPRSWIAEAARLLRPGGRLVFMRNSTLMTLCVSLEGPAGERLLRPQFGLYRIQWPDEEGVEFHPPHGVLLGILRDAGLEIERLLELQAPAAATRMAWIEEYVTAEWARQWPSDEIWVCRKP